MFKFILVIAALMSPAAFGKGIPECNAIAEQANAEAQKDGFKYIGQRGLPDGQAFLWANKESSRILVFKLEKLPASSKFRDLGQCKGGNDVLAHVYSAEAKNDEA